jgi:hypothetical protein
MAWRRPRTWATSPTPEPPPPQNKKHFTLSDILGEEYLLNLALGRESSRTNCG